MTKPNDAVVSTTRYFDDIPYGPFTDVPCLVPRECYDAAIELLVYHWSSLPQRPIAIYQIGQVNALGISDLDFVVVFPDGKPIDWTQYQPQTFPDWTQQLMTHPPYCCTESAWLDLPAWFPTFNLRHLWGDALPEPKIPDELASGCALGMLVDYLIVKVPRDFIWIAWERPLRVRILLAMLHSLKYILKLAERAGLAIPESAGRTVSEVDALRGSWFALVPPKRLEILAQLCGRVCDIAREVISQVDGAIVQGMGRLNNNSVRESCVGSSPDFFTFKSPWIYTEAMQTAFEYYSHSESGWVTWTSPLSFLQILAIYADECPRFGKYLDAQGCHTKSQWDSGVWNDGLRYHARAMVAYSESAMRLGVPAQKYIALGYSPPPPIWRRPVQCYAVRVLKGEVGLRVVMQRIALEVRRVLKSQ